MHPVTPSRGARVRLPACAVLAILLVLAFIAPALAGTPSFLIKDTAPGATGGAPSNLIRVNGSLYFITWDLNTFMGSLWRSDGSTDGTTIVASVPEMRNLTNVNGTIFFASGRTSLWKSDGTSQGTVEVKNNLGDPIRAMSNFTSVGDTLFFTAGGGLWKSDGTLQGTVELRPATGTLYDVFHLVPVGPALFFTSGYERELWKTDGTNAGTVMVKDIFPDSAGSYPRGLTNVNGLLFFSASDETSAGIWKSDGTDAGTVLVKPNLGITGAAARLKDFFIFVADTPEQGRELWKSDGTLAGTVLLKDINPFSSSSNPSNFLETSDRLFFYANDGVHGGELWASDGTPEGTTMVKDINPGMASSAPPVMDLPARLANIQDAAFFIAQDSTHGVELWTSDGSPSCTTLVDDLAAGQASAFAGEPSIVQIGTTIASTANDGMHGFELWGFGKPADLSLQGSDRVFAAPGESGMLTLQYATAAVLPTGSMTVSAELDPAITYLSDTSGIVPSINGTRVTWQIPNMAGLCSKQFSVRVRVPNAPRGTSYTIHFSVAAAAPEANLSNNSAQTTIVVGDHTLLPLIQR